MHSLVLHNYLTLSSVQSSVCPTSTMSAQTEDCKFLTTSWLWGRLFCRSRPVMSGTRDELKSRPAVNILQHPKQLLGGLRPSLPSWTQLRPGDVWVVCPCRLSSQSLLVRTAKTAGKSFELCKKPSESKATVGPRFPSQAFCFTAWQWNYGHLR